MSKASQAQTPAVTPTVTPAKVDYPFPNDRFGARPVRCGVVGVGRMGRHHARTYANLAGCKLVGVVDADKERRESVAETYGCAALERVDQLVDLGVDAVSIAVPTTYHFAAAEPLLKAKVACLIEKPLAGDVATAMRIKDLALTTGAGLMVGHIERFNPAMRAMQKLAAATAPFPVVPRFMQVIRVSPMSFRSVDVGVVMDMMIHDLDVVIMLMGGREPVSIRATGVSVVTGHEDLCTAWLEFDTPNGRCVADVTASRLALKTERVTRITGEHGYIKIDYGAKKGTVIRRLANEIQIAEVREQLAQGHDLTSLKWDQLVNVEDLAVDDAEPILMEIKAFIESVRTGQRPPIDAEAGFANVRTAERIVEAIRQAK